MKYFSFFIILLFFVQCKKQELTNTNIQESYKIPENLNINDEYGRIPDSITSNYLKIIDSSKIDKISTFFNLEIGTDSLRNINKLKNIETKFCGLNSVNLIENSRPFYYNLLNDEKNTYMIVFSSKLLSVATRKDYMIFTVNDFLKRISDCNYLKSNEKEDNLNYTFELLLKAFTNKYGNYNIRINSKFDNGQNYYWFKGQNLISLSYINFQSESLSEKFSDYPIYEKSGDIFDTQEQITISIENLLLGKRYESRKKFQEEIEYQKNVKNESLKQEEFENQKEEKIRDIEKKL